jgi:hypothetical protein
MWRIVRNRERRSVHGLKLTAIRLLIIVILAVGSSSGTNRSFPLSLL